MAATQDTRETQDTIQNYDETLKTNYLFVVAAAAVFVFTNSEKYKRENNKGRILTVLHT